MMCIKAEHAAPWLMDASHIQEPASAGKLLLPRSRYNKLQQARHSNVIIKPNHEIATWRHHG
jgi:hypothetical protein